MPIQTVERLQKRELGLRKNLAEKGEELEAGVRKRRIKQLKRAQRKRRKLVSVAERRAARSAKSKSE